VARSKKPQTDPPENLSEIEKRRIKAWCEKNYPKYVSRLGPLWGECRDHHLKAVQFDRERKAGGGRPQPGSWEMPQEGGPRGSGFTDLKGAEVVPLRKKET
jgi:hypothetical protein